MSKVYNKYLPEYLKTKKYVRINTADLATAIIEGCKKLYPQYTFSKSTRNYSGGSSVDIYLQTGWDTISGEESKEISRFVQQYSGACFDGMVDYKFDKDIWLTPEGLVEQASSQGSACTGGCYEAYSYEPTNPNSILISSGAWVSFCSYPKFGSKTSAAYDIFYKNKNQQEGVAA